MTRVWSIAGERSHSDEDCAEIEKAIVYLYADQSSRSASPSDHSTPVRPMQPPVPSVTLPSVSDTDSGYEASPSSATRLASFLFGSPSDTALDQTSGADNLRTGSQFEPCAQDMGQALPSQPSLPSPTSSISVGSHLTASETSNRANGSAREVHDSTGRRAPMRDPLPDVVNVEVRVRSGNGHNQARRAASVSLPIDAETIRSVGISLRRISEEFETSSRTMLSADSDPSSEGLFATLFSSLQLSRRSLSSRFRSHRNQYRNGRQRSLSTNDATQE